MSYRDDMEAALARIASLEARLRERGETASGTGELEAAKREIDRLAQELQRSRARQGDLEEKLEARATLEQKITLLRDQLAGLEGPAPLADPAAELVPVFDHNRRFRAINAGKPAGVLCPQCLAAGERVEMRRGIGAYLTTALDQGLSFDFANVCCPRCLLMSMIRIPMGSEPA